MLGKTLAVAQIILGLLMGTAVQAAPLPDFIATYKISRGVVPIGTSRISLTREPDGNYHYASHSWPSHWASWILKQRLHESSSGRIEAGYFRPDTYHYLRTGDDNERVAHLTFNWGANIVVNNVAGSRWRMPVPAGTQDKLSSQLGMMLKLARGETDFSFDLADGGTLKQYRFKVIGKEKLELPAGSFHTIKVAKLRGNSQRKTTVWCAPELSYLPVRIVHYEQDGAEYTSDLEGFSESLRVKAEK